jgi:hypothetical protein
LATSADRDLAVVGTQMLELLKRTDELEEMVKDKEVQIKVYFSPSYFSFTLQVFPVQF